MEIFLYIFQWCFRILFVFLFASIIIRCFCFMNGNRIKKIKRYTLNGIVAVLLLPVLMYCTLIIGSRFRERINFHPQVEIKDVIGEWHKGRKELILTEDGTVVGWLSEEKDISYTWSLDGSKIMIKKDNELLYEYLVVTISGEYRILDEPELLNLGYKKVK